MSSEAGLWQAVRHHLRPYGRLVRFENRVGPGTPDVYYCLRGAAGWVELKNLAEWPKRAATPITLPKLRPEQVAWLEAERAAGGRAWLLLRVGAAYLLLDPSTVRDAHRRALTRGQLEERAAVRSTTGFPTIPLVRALRE